MSDTPTTCAECETVSDDGTYHSWIFCIFYKRGCARAMVRNEIHRAADATRHETTEGPE